MFSTLELPVLYMVGKHSPASSRAVARLLIPALPNVECVEFEDLGHMGPITHPGPVNTAIMQFIERL
ncbi:Alpha/beta hydrolase family protein [compost metagenome]